ncbi:unnamed protein product [Blepharisma stoltei]|uniref:Globin family profile domain-containing protein n=1 Tax=Blepharisma stoltei TaxID=1481888 RepID=A0AAU9J2D2_9CILI|nr:unnamed protein product [Blepharisma stoltei]
MDIPRILEHLNDYHQNPNDENGIDAFSEEIKTLLAESTKILDSIGSDISWNTMISRINNLLPKSPNHQEIKFFSLLATHANSAKLNINIPTTLIRLKSEPSPLLIQTNKKNIVEIRECVEKEFFELESTSSSPGFPSFCFKNFAKEIVVAFSKETAAKLWNSSNDDALMQFFIQSQANPSAITRVLWKKGTKNKYFTIINRKAATKRLIHNASGTLTSKRKKLTTGFRYSLASLPSPSPTYPFKSKKSSKGENPFGSPYMSKNKSRRSDIFKTFSNDTKSATNFDNLIEKNMVIHGNKCKEYLVITNDTASCLASESFGKIEEIDEMVNEVAEFLTYHVFNRETKGLVLDFVKDINNKWFLLDCKEHLIDHSKHMEKSNKVHSPKYPLKLTDMDIPGMHRTDTGSMSELNHPMSARAKQVQRRKTVEKLTPIKKRKATVKMNDIYDRFNKINEKIDRLSSQKISHSSLTRSESIQNYLSNYNNFQPHLPDLTPTHASVAKFDKCPFGEQKHDESPVVLSTRKYFSEAVDNYEEMKMNVNIAKTKKINLFTKYGGEAFWSKFIVSLYNKVLGCDELNKYFKDSKIESFQMIVKGMFKMFHGNLNLELRGRLRAAHHAKGITVKEYNCYAEMFYLTLTEFKVDDEDIQGMMSQISMMKSLICKDA